MFTISNTQFDQSSPVHTVSEYVGRGGGGVEEGLATLKNDLFYIFILVSLDIL